MLKDKAIYMVDLYFNECTYVDIFDFSPTINICNELSAHPLLNIKEYTFNKTKTHKVLIRDKFLCKTCELSASHVVIMKRKDNDDLLCTFAGFYDDYLVPFTKDHIVAKSRGGSNAFKNLQSMCYTCNQHKADDYISCKEKRKDRYQPKKQICEDEYEVLLQRQKDFAIVRKAIKNITKKMPWYYRLFGMEKFIYRHLKEPLIRKGYYK